MKQAQRAELRIRRNGEQNGVRDSRANLTRRCGGAKDVRKERKEMEGGNGVRVANVVTL